MSPIRFNLILARFLTASIVCLLLTAQVSADGVESNPRREVEMSPGAIHDGYDLFLVVEYTRTALTAMMLTGMCD